MKIAQCLSFTIYPSVYLFIYCNCAMYRPAVSLKYINHLIFSQAINPKRFLPSCPAWPSLQHLICYSEGLQYIVLNEILVWSDRIISFWFLCRLISSILKIWGSACHSASGPSKGMLSFAGYHHIPPVDSLSCLRFSCCKPQE